MRSFSDYPRKNRILIVLGIALLVVGAIGLANEYFVVGWWHLLVDKVLHGMRIALPVAIILLAAYLVSASRRGVLADVLHPKAKKRFVCSRADRRFLGVCGGFAASRQVDPVFVRTIVLLLFVAFPPAVLIAYLFVALATPSG